MANNAAELFCVYLYLGDKLKGLRVLRIEEEAIQLKIIQNYHTIVAILPHTPNNCHKLPNTTTK